MKRRKILVVLTLFATGALAFVNVNISVSSEKSPNNKVKVFRSFKSEALSGESNETNPWYQWLSQGFTKDEREWKRKCPSSRSSSGSGSASYGGASVSGSGSSSTTNPSDREEITCPYGEVNCTAIDCD